MRIILASASPRRKELLSKLFAEFEIIPAAGEEHRTKELPADIVLELSGQKAHEVECFISRPDIAQNSGSVEFSISRPDIAQRSSCSEHLKDGIMQDMTDQTSPQDAYLIIGADTVVAYEGKILGKPEDEEDAVNTLRMLSGNKHQVYTGVTAILARHGRRECIRFFACTDVTFSPMSDAEIRAYAASGEPMDKAGSYGIQGIGGRFVEKIDGDYNNVVGLPVAKLYQALKSHLEMF